MKMKPRVLGFVFAVFIFVYLPSLCLSSHTHDDDDECKAWVVQSIPTHMPNLSRVPGVLSTSDVFRWLAGNSSKSLDIMAQYWQLVASPHDPRSGDFGYSKEDMQSFGAQEGLNVYKAIENAADRKVKHSGVYPDFTKEPSDLASGRPNVQNVTLLLSKWWGSGIVHAKVWISDHKDFYIGSANNDWKSLTQAYWFPSPPDFTKEPSDLASGRPNVQNVTLLLSKWWGSGIVHAKVWISDHKDFYIGSANNDWKSLTQVKEVGIYVADCPKIAKMVEVYYNNLWILSSLNASEYTTTTWDQQWQINRTVPCWSYFVPTEDRCRSPLPRRYLKVNHVAGYPVLSDPFMMQIPLHTDGDSHNTTSSHYPSYLSFAPPELLFGKFQTDEQAWVDTIKSVRIGGIVRINTMDWLGQSQYTKETIYWSTLSSAISEVVFSKKATVRLLVARWAHFISDTDEYLKSLLYTNVLCHSSTYNHCNGTVEIKYYEVPGYNSTGPALSKGAKTGNTYPGYTRVNHGKYAVSNVRAHIGTSNLIWDYFYNTAGVSFGTYNPSIVSQLQQVFDADWNSPYVVPVQPLQSLAFSK